MIVQNVPEYAQKYAYVVARLCDGQLWFWGAWDDFEKAKSVANEIDGIVVKSEDIE